MIDKIKSMDTGKLVDVVQNYELYGYDLSIRDAAIIELNERGVTTEELIFHGKDKSGSVAHAQDLIRSYSRNSIIALVCYCALIVSLFTINTGVSEIILVPLILFLLFIGFLIASAINLVTFNKAVNERDGSSGVLLYILLGMPLFIFAYFYFKGKMKEEAYLVK